MGHVQRVPLDHLVQMLAAIEPYSETMRLLDRVERKHLQLAAIDARTRQLRVLSPVPRRCRRPLAPHEDKLCAVFPEPCHRVISLSNQGQRRHEYRYRIEHAGARGEFLHGGGTQRRRVQFAQHL